MSVAGWLACSPPDYPYRIGVVGADLEEARQKFAAAVVAWEELHQRAETGATAVPAKANR